MIHLSGQCSFLFPLIQRVQEERSSLKDLAGLLGWGWMSDVGLYQPGFVPKDKAEVLVQPQALQSDRFPAGSFLTFLPISWPVWMSDEEGFAHPGSLLNFLEVTQANLVSHPSHSPCWSTHSKGCCFPLTQQWQQLRQIPAGRGGWSCGHSLHLRLSESWGISETTLACVQAGLWTWCMPEREAQSPGAAVSFQITFSPYPVLRIAVFPNRRGRCHTFFCALCEKCRVSSSGEHSLFIIAKYVQKTLQNVFTTLCTPPPPY